MIVEFMWFIKKETQMVKDMYTLSLMEPLEEMNLLTVGMVGTFKQSINYPDLSNLNFL